MTVLPDDDDNPSGLHVLPSGLRTPPTPPVDLSQLSPAAPLPRRLHAGVQLWPVSIPEIERDMAGESPQQKIADLDRHCMPDGVPASKPEASVHGNADNHRSSLKL